MSEIPDSVLKAAHDYDYAHRAGNWQRVPDNQVRRLLDGLATQGLILVRADDPCAVTQETLVPLNARITIAEAKLADTLQRAEEAEQEAARQRDRADMAERAIIGAVARIKTINLAGEPPPDPCEWDRGYWACVDTVIGSVEAPYVDAALELIKSARQHD